MKRSLALLAALAVVATPLAAQAAPPKPPKKTTRVVTGTYTLPRGVASTAVLNVCAAPGSCPDFETVKGEKNISFEVTDMSGRPVAINVYPTGEFASNQAFCGKGVFKVSPKSGVPITVRAVLSPDCQGIPTSGTVTATITNF